MVKRFFDVLFSLIGLLCTSPIILFFWILASIDTQSNGFFIQERIGQWGKVFKIYKLQTIHPLTRKMSFFGAFLRKSKMDEIPQLWNVLKGEMSFVGPRPDIAGYYDLLQGEARKILELKPGITSEASIKYKNEDFLLKQQSNPLEYNDTVIFPDKVQMNLDYYYNHSFWGDIKVICKTVFI
ncbi:MAG TPA: sugar transferase [Flavobacterium sp.]